MASGVSKSRPAASLSLQSLIVLNAAVAEALEDFKARVDSLIAKGEDRILVPSPKVATYDLKPEMSAYEVKDKLVGAINTQEYDFCVRFIDGQGKPVRNLSIHVK